MKGLKRGLIILLILAMLFLTLGMVSASDNSLDLTHDDSNNINSQMDLNIDEKIDSNLKESSLSSTVSGNNFKDIENAVNSSDDGLIQLENDFIYDETNDGDFSNGIVVNKNLTIDGQGYTIDANSNGNNVRIFNIRNSEVTIKNLVLKNAYVNENGAAILITNSKVTIQNCTFINNYAKNYGGAIRFYGPNGTVTNCTFIGNNATHGGAVYWSNGPNGTLKDSVFVDNHGARGGAVYWFSADGTINNCSFENNTANGNHGGGAVYWYGDRGTIQDSSFVNNSAYENYASGGAVYWYYGANGLIHNSSFINNSAEYGGSVRWDTDNGKVEYSNFTNNWAHYEQDFLWKGFNATIIDSSFHMNSLLLNNTLIASIFNCKFIEASNMNLLNVTRGNISNSHFENTTLLWNGSNMGLFDDSFINTTIKLYGDNQTLENSSFLYNINPVKIVGCNSYINFCNFSYNNRSLNILGNNCSLNNCFFLNNTYNYAIPYNYSYYVERNIFGGCISFNGSNFLINNTKFINNHLVYSINQDYLVEDFNNIFGGVLFISGDGALITNSSFTNNTLTSSVKINRYKANLSSNGGAIYLEGLNHIINNCDFSYNSVYSSSNNKYMVYARSNGGAIYINSSYSSVINSTFKSNYARASGYLDNEGYPYGEILSTSFGGALYNNGVKNVIISSNFTDNFAESNTYFYREPNSYKIYSHGGAICSNNNLNISDAIFSNNTLNSYKFADSWYSSGGAIYLNGSDYNIVNSKFLGNNITNSYAYGGSIYLDVISCKLVNSTFNNSYSPYYAGAIYQNSGKLDIIGCDFNYCSSKYNGVITNSRSELNLYSSNFTNCFSTDDSSIIINPSNINNSIFIGNGELNNNKFLLENPRSISYSSFLNNKVVVIYSDEVFTNVDKSSFVNNDMGVIFLTEGYVNTSYFINNSGIAVRFSAPANVSNSIFINNKDYDIFAENESVVNYNYYGTNNGPSSHSLSPKVTYDNYVLFNIESPGDYVLWEDNVSIYGGLIQYTDGQNIYNMTEDMPPLTIKLLVDIGEVDSLVIDSQNAKVNASYFAANVGYETFSVRIFDITETTIFEVIDKKFTSLSAENITVTYGRENFFEVKLNDNKQNVLEGRSISLYVDGALYDTKLTSNENIAKFNVSNLTKGNHSVSAVFEGDGNLINSNLTDLWIFVNSAKTNIEIENISTKVGSSIIISSKVTDDEGNDVNVGGVNYYIDDDFIGFADLVDSYANLSYVASNYGNFTLKAVYEESDNYLASNASCTLFVDKKVSVISISASSFDYKNPSDIVISLKDEDGLAIGDKYFNLTISKDDENIKQELKTNSDGLVTINKDLNAGEWLLFAQFNEDGTYYGSNSSEGLTVNKLYSFVSIDDIGEVFASKETVFSVNVISDYAVNEGIVEYYINGTKIGTGNVVDGKSNISYVFNSSGDYVLKVVYTNSSNYDPYTANVTFTVSKLSTSINASNISVYCGDVSVVRVSIYDMDGRSLSPSILELVKEDESSENVSLIGGKIVLDSTKWDNGKYQFVLKYSGDAIYSLASCEFEVNINKRATSLEVSNYTSYINQLVVLKVNVSSSNLVNEGTVSFILNGNSEDVDVIDGVASYEYYCTESDIFSFDVIYNENSLYNSSSNSFTLTVKNLIATTLVINGYEVYEDNILVNVSLKDSNGDLEINNLTVVYNNGSDEVLPVIGGIITIPNDNLDAGGYSFLISYLEDGIYSNSDAVFNFTIPKKNTYLILSNYTIKLNEELNYEIKLYDENNNLLDGNNSVILNLKNKNYLVYINDGIGLINLDNFKNCENITVNVEFLENKNYLGTSSSSIINVLARDTSINLIIQDVFVNDPIGIDISLTDNEGNLLNEDIKIKLNNTVLNGYSSTDKKINEAVSVGEYNITVEFEGNANYHPSNYSTIFKVLDHYTLTLDVLEVGSNKSSVTVNLKDSKNNGVANAKIKLIVNNNSADVFTDNDGKYDLVVGSNSTVEAIYIYDNGLELKASLSLNTIIEYVNVTQEVLIYPNATIGLVYDGGFVTASLKDLNNQSISQAVLLINVNGVSFNSITNNNGESVISINGNATVLVSYTDSNGITVSSSINVINNTEIKEVEKIVYVNQTVEVPINASISLRSENGKVIANLTDLDGAPISNALLEVIINGVPINGAVTDGNGIYSVDVDGNVTVVVSYYNESASVSASIKIINSTVEKIVENNITEYVDVPVPVNATIELVSDGNSITATLRDLDNQPISKAILTVNVNGISFNSLTNDNGEITFNINGNATAVVSYTDSNGVIVSSSIKVINNTDIQEVEKIVYVNQTVEVPVEVEKIVYVNNTVEVPVEVEKIVYVNNTVEVPVYIHVTPERTATKIIYQNMTTTSVNSKVDGRIGKYFEVKLVDDKGKELANKTVYIGFNGRVYERQTDENGEAKLQINLGYQGDYTFAIAFLGDDNYTGSFEVAIIKVSKQSPKLTAPSKTYKSTAKTKALTATLKSANGNAISGKKISFTVNGKTYTATTNAKGIATVNVSLNNKGTYSFVAKYAGDGMYQASTVSNKLIIK